MATQIDAITEARNNLSSIDKEIDAIMEQITTLQAKVDNLRNTKRQDEAFIRIVEMREQGKDLSSLFDQPKSRMQAKTSGDRAAQPRTVRDGTRAPRANLQAIIDAAREILEKEGSLTRKDVAAYVLNKGIEVTGKDDEARQRNVGLTMERNDTIFRKDGANFSLVE